jgi:hypothetical protein
MLMNLICQQYGYQLRDSGENQVGMERFFILRVAVC